MPALDYSLRDSDELLNHRSNAFSPVGIGPVFTVCVRALQEVDTETGLGLREVYWGNPWDKREGRGWRGQRASGCSAGLTPVKAEGKEGALGRKSLGLQRSFKEVSNGPSGAPCVLQEQSCTGAPATISHTREQPGMHGLGPDTVLGPEGSSRGCP